MTGRAASRRSPSDHASAAVASTEALPLLPHRWPGPANEATLVARPNRFLAVCAIGPRRVAAHVPDRGRCLDLLVPGQPLILVAAPVAAAKNPNAGTASARRTQFTALLARARTAPCPWVSLDPAGAPRLVEAALAAGLLRSLAPLQVAAREVTVGDARIDLLLAEPGAAALFAARAAAGGEAARALRARALEETLRSGVLCEVKSVGAARDGVALFPDAPTLRGVRHLALLARRARRGLGAALVLCAQRGDVNAIAADRAIDPVFAAALSRARKAGVRVVGLACAASPDGMRVLREIPVL